MRKKILSISLCVLLACSLFAVNTGAAGNISDSYQKLDLSTSKTSYTDTARPKYDTTSAYQRCIESSGLPYISYVYGLKVGGSKYNASGGNVYTLTKNTTKYMINYVRENYNKNSSTYTNFAGMACYPKGTGGINSFTVKFYWSPDSV